MQCSGGSIVVEEVVDRSRISSSGSNSRSSGSSDCDDSDDR